MKCHDRLLTSSRELRAKISKKKFTEKSLQKIFFFSKPIEIIPKEMRKLLLFDALSARKESNLTSHEKLNRGKNSREIKTNPNATFWLDWIIKKHLVSSHDDELTSFLQHFRSKIFSARWKMFSQAYCIIFNELKWILLSDGSKQTVWGTRELSELLMNSKCFQIEEGKKFSVPLKLRPIHNCVLNKFAFAAKGRREHFQHFSDASGKN